MNSKNERQAYVVNPPPTTALPVRGRDKQFPLRRVYCVGRNYTAHAVEMGHDPDVGVTREYVPCREKEQPPCGCSGQLGNLAMRHP